MVEVNFNPNDQRGFSGSNFSKNHLPKRLKSYGIKTVNF